MCHMLVRTNPVGEKFVGRCVNCGKENLPMSAVHEECENLTKRSYEDSFARIIRGDKD